MKTTKFILLFGFTAMIIWSCSDSTTANNWGDSTSPPYEKAKRVAAPADSLIGLAHKIPGFGGLFINKAGELTIYLTDPATQKETAKTVLSNSELIGEALSNTSASVENMAIKKGQYTFIELHTWKVEASGKIMAIDGVYSAGIDQSRNKLTFGVKNKAVRDRAAKKVQQLNIPRDAVLFYQMTQPEYY